MAVLFNLPKGINTIENIKIMTIEELETKVGQILYVKSRSVNWMFKLLKVIKTESGNGNVYVITLFGLDVYPNFRYYCGNPREPHYERIPLSSIRTPTKKELNLFREITREAKILGKNKL